MKGVRLSLMYQYFDVQERKLNEQISALERLPMEVMSAQDILLLIQLKAKREALQMIFSDLFKFSVDFDEDFK